MDHSTTFNTKNILVLVCGNKDKDIDDICILLETMGIIKLLCANNEKESISLSTRYKPDLIIVSDCNLKEKFDSIDLIKSLTLSNPKSVIILQSKNERGIYPLTAMAAGVSGWVNKSSKEPVDDLPTTLSQWMNVIINRYNARNIIKNV